LIDKPAGLTSHDVVARVRRIMRTRAVGHTGTLDPFATGLLVIVLGAATRLARFVEAERKTYLAEAVLGQRTTTDDRTGDPVGPAQQPVAWPTEDQVRAALAGFLGRSLQRPPAFSAKRVGGERSYRLARRGEAVELAPVPIEVSAIELVAYHPPALAFRATVGPGTYLRALARDLGEVLGTGAHLTALRRERVGAHRVEDAVPLEALTPETPLRAPLELVGHFPAVAIDAETAGRVRHGQSIGGGEPGSDGPVALVDGGALVAVAEPRDGRWQPVVVLSA
jgi:tRNA pseudouridine55 synthase